MQYVSNWFIRSVQAVILIALFTWALFTVSAILKRIFPLQFQEHPRGSYLAVSGNASSSRNLQEALLGMIENAGQYARLGS